MGNLDFTDSIYDAQQGSQSAIKFIYDNTIQLFYKEACVFMRDKNEADLAVQDAYDFIFSHLDSLEDSSRFLVWANEVCKNTCISRLKQAGAFDGRIPAEASNLGEISVSADYDPMINMNASMPPTHVQACLDAILNSLPDNQRASAILWGEGYPVRSISRKLGISRAAVNYTLAYALGNITNSVTTLRDNGLPLYSMEPIPYFLWLLINYYQYYQPDNLDLLVHSSFPAVLRKLLPDEASIYSSGYSDTYSSDDVEDLDPRIHHVSSPDDAEKLTAASVGVFAQSLDISSFINAGSDTSEKSADASADMEVYVPHPQEKTEKDESEDSGAEETDAQKTEDQSAEDKAEGSEEAAEGSDSEADPDKKDSIFGAAGAAEAGTEGVSEGEAQAADETAAKDTSGISSDTRPVNIPEAPPEKKRHTGLLIVLIIIAALILICAAALIFGGNTLKKKVNDLLGTTLFNIVQETTEPETTSEEETTPEETTPEPTTPEPTTPEETTTEEATTEAEPSLPYDVTIYADGIALGMRAVPGGDDGQPRLTYVPSDTRITIDEIQNGWGHTVYTDEDGTYDGWIWMGFTKVAENAPVEKPEEFLETPVEYTVGDLTGSAELRTGPGSSYSTFGPIPAGTVLTIEANDAGGAWGYTSYNGHHGWIVLY